MFQCCGGNSGQDAEGNLELDGFEKAARFVQKIRRDHEFHEAALVIQRARHREAVVALEQAYKVADFFLGNLRITSYNVCYTKLLRRLVERGEFLPVGIEFIGHQVEIVPEVFEIALLQGAGLLALDAPALQHPFHRLHPAAAQAEAGKIGHQGIGAGNDQA